MENIDQIKQKLFEHLDKNFPKEQADSTKDKINKMNDEEFLNFLEEQGLVQGNQENQCIFCALASGKIPRTEILENEKAICILELNPISLGHSLIIPKNHITSEKDIPKEVHDLKEQAKIEIERTFRPKRVDFINSNIMGHEIINILPIYSNETIESERTKKTKEELFEIKKQIENSKPKEIEIKKETKEIEEKKVEEIPKEEKLWLPKRFP